MAAGRIFLILVVSSLCFSCLATRTVKTEILRDPNCTEPCRTEIGHVQATGQEDTLHYLITNIGIPTIYVLRTNTINEPNTSVKVDWNKLASENTTERSEAITFPPVIQIFYSYAAMFTRMFEYNDTLDNADITKYNVNNTAWNVYNFADFDWDDLSNASDVNSNVINFMISSNMSESLGNGTISLKIQAFDHGDRENQLPHLQYTENIVLFDLVISHISTNLSASRFVVEMIMYSNSTDNMEIKTTASIDDEYTPGVFKISNWLTRPTNQAEGCFIQWKPVCYQNIPRGRNVATYVSYYGPSGLDSDQDMMKLVDRSILGAFEESTAIQFRMTATNFSFGLSKDGGYTSKNYTAWSGTLGFGAPPEEKVSTLVIIIIAAGLGLPVVIIIFGGIGVCVKKQTGKQKKILQEVTRNYPGLN
ncbi:hypothetical protein ACJMK2_043458 [Sinanodonta woodiana]|uniref:Lysosomal protein NCU-G1 n=1 Tax=Sinanodonta woodiana TaxID=1069815 RepID=A0ABD3W046_SINWO